MDRRTWGVTALLGLSAVLLAGVTVAGQMRISDADERREVSEGELAALEPEPGRVEGTLASKKAGLADLEGELAVLRRYFTVDSVGAATQVQALLIDAGCDQARSAVRAGTEPPSAADLIRSAVAGGQGEESLPEMDGRLAQMIDPTPIQFAVDLCAGR